VTLKVVGTEIVVRIKSKKFPWVILDLKGNSVNDILKQIPFIAGYKRPKEKVMNELIERHEIEEIIKKIESDLKKKLPQIELECSDIQDTNFLDFKFTLSLNYRFISEEICDEAHWKAHEVLDKLYNCPKLVKGGQISERKDLSAEQWPTEKDLSIELQFNYDDQHNDLCTPDNDFDLFGDPKEIEAALRYYIDSIFTQLLAHEPWISERSLNNKNDNPVERIVCFQGEEADRYIQILEEDGVKEVMDHLLNWYVSPEDHDCAQELSHGPSDTVITVTPKDLGWNERKNFEFCLTYNSDYSLISLEKYPIRRKS